MSAKLLFPHLQSMRIEGVALDGATVTLAGAVEGTTAYIRVYEQDKRGHWNRKCVGQLMGGLG